MRQAALPGSATGKRSLSWVSSRIVVPVLLFIICYGLTLFSDVGTSGYLLDKSWFLQVVQRVTSGEVLYRDVWCLVTPLSVYLTAAITAPFGNEYLVAEAVWTVWLVAIVLLTARIARQAGLSEGTAALLELGTIVFMVPWIWGPYSLLATLWLLVCCSAALSWLSLFPGASKAVETRANRWLIVAGGAAGLCFASKQNLGIYALVALGLTLLARCGWADRRHWPHIFALAVGPFLLVTLVVLVPVWASGGLDKLIAYGFTTQDSFVQVAGIGYDEAATTLAHFLSGLGSGMLQEQLYWQLLFLLPPIAAIALIGAWLRAGRGERARATALLAFAAAITLMLVPRATLPHLVYALPLLLIGLTYAGRQLAPGPPMPVVRTLQVGLALWLLLGVGLIVFEPIGHALAGDYTVSRLPHFRGVLIGEDAADDFRTAEKLSGLADDGEAPLLLGTRAGFFYLASGVHDPTPYDDPLVTAFGREGEANVIGALERGQIRLVCRDHDFSSTDGPRHLRPTNLLLYVEQQMKLRRDLGTCSLYAGHR
jgi:hypothetical protein